MRTRSVGSVKLDALLRPRSIAIVGASARAGSFGARLLDAVTGGRYAGRVYPVNPRYHRLGEHECYPDLGSLPEQVDCAAFAVGDELVEAALGAAARAGVRGAVLFGRCYEDARIGGPSRVSRLAAIAREAGIAVCGNNCMGFFNFVDGLRISGNPPPLPDGFGAIALVSHSGSTWSGLVGNQRDLRFNYAVSAGQEIATGLADYMDFFLAQPATRVIGCIMETVRDPERFLGSLAEADRRGIPVVALKLARTERGRRFALAHSGALAGSDAAYRAIFARYNVVPVGTVDEFMDTLELFSSARRPSGGGIGIVTDSGGERELIVDLATEVGAPLAEISPVTRDRLAEILDPGMEPQNPVDSYGDGRMLLEECLLALADDPGVGIVALATNLVHGRPYARASADAIIHAAAATAKPALLFSNVQSAVSASEAARLRTLSVPVLMGTVSALGAMRRLIEWQRCRQLKGYAEPAVAKSDHIGATRALIQKAGPGTALPVGDALRLLAIFGIPFCESRFAEDVAGAVSAAKRLGFPIVLKTASPDILHKTEVGGVAIGLQDPHAVIAAYSRIAERCGPAVQVQAQAPEGAEILLGMTNDLQFGPMVTIGSGGVLTELLEDVVTFTPVADRRFVRNQIETLRAYRLLTGFRGRPPADLDALVTIIGSFASLCASIGHLFEAIDLNPIMVSPAGAVAVDALFIRSGSETHIA